VGTLSFARRAGLDLTPPESPASAGRNILTLTSQLLPELARVSMDVNATLVVAAVESLNAYVLPPHLAALRERWPKVHLEVVTGTCADIRQSIAAGQSQLGLVLEGETRGRGRGQDASILTTGRLVVLAAPAHPLAQRSTSADQLRRCDFLMSDAGGPYARLLEQYFEAAQIPPPRTQSLGNVEGVKRGILAGGAALGLLPAHAVERELREGTLTAVEVHPALPPSSSARWSRRGGGIPAGRGLIQSLRGLAWGPDCERL
jgi:DNA-binding transcriptional LysR family regulator